jgi:O-antigen ligase
MCAGLVVGLSRSGLIAGTAGLIAFAWLSSSRMSRRSRIWFLAGQVIVVLAAAVYANPRAIWSRVNETAAVGLGGRRTIWLETWPMVRDFWTVGIGAGAYQRGMIVYQHSSPEFYFNHAHNEYLQLVAEGGMLLAIPMLLAAGAALWVIASRVAGDRSSAFSIRAGAVGGLVTIAVQSLWETGLRVPANGLLFAVLAAVAVAERPLSVGAAAGRPPQPFRRAAQDPVAVGEWEQRNRPRIVR